MAILLLWAPRGPLYREARVGSRVYRLEVARTVLEQSRGLSGRDVLEKDAGMLFAFPYADRYSFWMRGMRFPLDFVWIRGDKVVGVTENKLPPCEGNLLERCARSLSLFTAAAPFDRVLELNAGEAEANGVKTGDSVVFSL